MQHADLFIAILMAIFATLILIYLWRARKGHVPYIRRIAGITSMEEAVGRATELGQPIVFATGLTGIRDIETHAALSILSHVARMAARLRTPLITLVSQPDVYPFAEEVMREAYKAEGVLDQLNVEDQIRFLSNDSVMFSLGVGSVIKDNKAGCALFFGVFDFASLIMAEPGAQMGIIQIAGTPALPQVPFFICTCDYTIIGEEYFAAGAYVSEDPTLRSSLVSQDLIKVIFVALIVVGTICVHLNNPIAQWIVKLLTGYK